MYELLFSLIYSLPLFLGKGNRSLKMLGRRYLRARAMQFLYAQHLSGEDPRKVEHNMLHSIDKIFDLYVCLLAMLLGLQEKFLNKLQILKKKILPTYEDLHPNKKFAYNRLLALVSRNPQLREYIAENQQLNWKNHEEYLSIFFRQLQELSLYRNYCSSKEDSFEEDKNFILHYYEECFADHEKLYECLGDGYITWSDDLSTANVMVYNTLKFIKSDTSNDFRLYEVYRDAEDKNFVQQLFRKTYLYKDEFNILISQTSNHWELKRIAFLDLIILQMSMCEFLYFPSIPPRATMNEYIEITKIYSTEKSKTFINGILDQLFKNLTNQNKIHKSGRGLL
ncbi:transcription antitermination factor NusB [Bacteroidetes bacterium endosymbiont of Geopemphigus sp.]|uniref:transcription antitermination factor NusB n=1 Tax=Bacteroidetes bacterium endosymbiont of Geopemphigus sp. TaxID=2047937 RepID=UPI001F4D57A7|nr:transcription antitermination factor NusB [Bacteroidetes bacterium endosymbiont of Geopemphigus sp.]